MLQPAYVFNMGQNVKEGLVTIAKLDGQKPNLICGTEGGNIFIHSPHESLEGNKSQNYLRFLDINKNVLSLASGCMDMNSAREILIFASSNILTGFDTENNQDLFYVEIPEGITCVAFPPIQLSQNKNKSQISNQQTQQQPLCYIGGNCFINGYNKQGEEQFWNVCSDNVTAIGFCDLTGDGCCQLLVASEDNFIRAYKGDDIIMEIQEGSYAVCLVALYDFKFAYGLHNGQVGVYKKSKRIWKTESKYRPISLVVIQPESANDSFSALIIGWQNGRIEIRNDNTGESLFRTTLQSNVAKVIKYDYRLENIEQIVCVCTDGSVNGFNYKRELQKKDGLINTDIGKQVEALNALTKQKNQLHMEMTGLQDKQNILKDDGQIQESLVIPENTKLTGEFFYNKEKKCPQIRIQANNLSVLKGVIIFAEKVFETDSILYFPKQQSNEIQVPLKIVQNAASELDVKILVGSSSGTKSYQVYQIKIKLPKFSKFMQVDSINALTKMPSSKLQFQIKERIQRFIKWLDQCFILEQEFLLALEKQPKIELTFLDLSTMQTLFISFDQANNGTTIICSDSMQLAGEIVQDICDFMSISDLQSIADFPKEMEEFKEVLQLVHQHDTTKTYISGDIAQQIGNVKTFIVKAEDARILLNMHEMKTMYGNIMIENRKLLNELIQRNKNHENLLGALKKLSLMINKAGNLRNGPSKQRIIQLCRQAIKNHNVFSLIQIIRNGQEA